MVEQSGEKVVQKVMQKMFQKVVKNGETSSPKKSRKVRVKCGKKKRWKMVEKVIEINNKVPNEQVSIVGYSIFL